MSEESQYAIDDQVIFYDKPSRHTPPHLVLLSRIEGPCFTLEVEALREAGDLRIDTMRVVGRALDGSARVVYKFNSRIDPAGVKQLAPALVQFSATHDVQFLLKVFQITQAYSVGDWEAEVLSHEISVAPCRLLVVAPSFEIFCKDPGVLSRLFWCPRHADGPCNEKLEAELAGWGEFVELRVLLRAAEALAPFVLEQYIKVLLPSRPSRTYEESYYQVKDLLEDIAEAYQQGGVAAIEELLRAESYEAIYRRGLNCHPQLATRSFVAPTLRPDRDEFDIASIGACLAYEIVPERGLIKVILGDAEQAPHIELLITPSQPLPKMAAYHIRCMFSLIDSIRSQRWTPTDCRVESAPWVCLGWPIPAATPEKFPKGSPLGDAAMSIAIAASAAPSAAHHFLSEEGYASLCKHSTCSIQSNATSQRGIIERALRGARWFALALPMPLVSLQPQLFSRLVIFLFPDGTLHIEATNELGGIASSILRHESVPSEQLRREICDQISHAFVEQELKGWLIFLERLREIAARAGLGLQDTFITHNLPAAFDPNEVASFTLAAKLAELLLRGGDTGLRCSLAMRIEGCFVLRAQNPALAGAVEIEFSRGSITMMSFQYLPVGPMQHSNNWVGIGTLEYQGTALHKTQYYEILSCVRSFLRDRHSPEAQVAPRPEYFIFEKIATRLIHAGFMHTVSPQR